MRWRFSPRQLLFHKPFQRNITQLQPNPVNSFPQISPNKALLMHHLTPNTWPFRQQADLLSPSPSSSLQKGVKTCPYPPWGMLGKEGLHICPKPQGGEMGNIPSFMREKWRKKERKKKWALFLLTSESDWKEPDRKWRIHLQRFCEWTMDLVSLWSHPSLAQKPSGQREGSGQPRPCFKRPGGEKEAAMCRWSCDL